MIERDKERDREINESEGDSNRQPKLAMKISNVTPREGEREKVCDREK